jgi:hypothetical protein
MINLSMVVHDFDVLGRANRPPKADTQLVIDPDAVLTLPVAPQGLQSVPRRDSQVIEAGGDLELAQLASSYRRAALEAPDALASCESFAIGASERTDHATR